jgi:hypothetical protein
MLVLHNYYQFAEINEVKKNERTSNVKNWGNRMDRER